MRETFQDGDEESPSGLWLRKWTAMRGEVTHAEQLAEFVSRASFEAETFEVAYHIIGGGDEGDKTVVRTKEQADHSLPYLISVALLDGQVMPVQYSLERINRRDVQDLLNRVSIHPLAEFSKRFPNEMPCRLTITFADGRVITNEIHDYPALVNHPMSWEMTLEKFEKLAGSFATRPLRRSIADAVKNLESVRVRELTRLLENLGTHRDEAQTAVRVGKE
ncbi:MAG: hypothetical protein WAK48_21615 [Candidatus Acidiferrum sp.]|jgi:2-methylcitrate dehydratase